MTKTVCEDRFQNRRQLALRIDGSGDARWPQSMARRAEAQAQGAKQAWTTCLRALQAGVLRAWPGCSVRRAA